MTHGGGSRAFHVFIRQITRVAATTLIMFSLTTLGIALWHMFHDIRSHAQHTLAVIGTLYGTGLSQALHTYNQPDESHIWVIQGGRVVLKSPNARTDPPKRIMDGFIQTLNSYQFATSHRERTFIIDVPLNGYDFLATFLLVLLVFGSAAGTLIIRAAAGALLQKTLQPVDSMISSAEHMLNAGTTEPLPIPSPDDAFYDLSVLINRLLFDLRERHKREQAQLADVTHHLRTLLTVIQGNLNVLQRDGLTSSPGKAALTAIDSTTFKMKSLVSDLLIMEQASNFSPDLLKPMRYWDLVQEVAEYARAFISEFPHISFETAAGWDSEIQILVHPEFARRAFWTIVDNAVKYCDSSRGYIGIFPAGNVPGFIGITVANNGREISPADMPHIFGRFYRGTHSRDIPGIGLGLSLARSLIRAQNGTIDITSKNGLTRVTLRFHVLP